MSLPNVNSGDPHVSAHNAERNAINAVEALVKTPAQIAADPAIAAGTGSPEGVVPGPVGAGYKRLDGGIGTAFYRKESGTGSTGWVAKYFQSRLRIRKDLDNAHTYFTS